jgi:hypothetical protein
LVKGVSVPDVSTPPPSTLNNWAHCVLVAVAVVLVVVVVTVVVVSVSVVKSVSVDVAVVVVVSVTSGRTVVVVVVAEAVSGTIVVVVVETVSVWGVTMRLQADDIWDDGKERSQGGILSWWRLLMSLLGAVKLKVVVVVVEVLRFSWYIKQSICLKVGATYLMDVEVSVSVSAQKQ